MKKLWAIAALVLFVSSAAGQVWFEGTFEDALVKAKDEGKLVLIDFFSDG